MPASYVIFHFSSSHIFKHEIDFNIVLYLTQYLQNIISAYNIKIINKIFYSLFHTKSSKSNEYFTLTDISI